MRLYRGPEIFQTTQINSDSNTFFSFKYNVSTDRGTNSLSIVHFYLIKAYDFIYHGILLAKLVSYGIGGTINLTLNLCLLYSKNLVEINNSDGIVYTKILLLLLQK